MQIPLNNTNHHHLLMISTLLMLVAIKIIIQCRLINLWCLLRLCPLHGCNKIMINEVIMHYYMRHLWVFLVTIYRGIDHLLFWTYLIGRLVKVTQTDNDYIRRMGLHRVQVVHSFNYKYNKRLLLQNRQ